MDHPRWFPKLCVCYMFSYVICVLAMLKNWLKGFLKLSLQSLAGKLLHFLFGGGGFGLVLWTIINDSFLQPVQHSTVHLHNSSIALPVPTAAHCTLWRHGRHSHLEMSPEMVQGSGAKDEHLFLRISSSSDLEDSLTRLIKRCQASKPPAGVWESTLNRVRRFRMAYEPTSSFPSIGTKPAKSKARGLSYTKQPSLR